MAQFKSIFGENVSEMQYLIDRRIDQFAPTVFSQYLTWAVPEESLMFETVIGRRRTAAIASVVSRDSLAPLRSRDRARSITGRIPAIKEKFKLTESETRAIINLTKKARGSAAQLEILDLMFNDVRTVGNAAMQRVDYMFHEAISTGYIHVTVENNPDGIITPEKLNIGFNEDTNYSESLVSWDAVDATTFKPFTDIASVVAAARTRGIRFTEIKMSTPTFQKMIKAKEVIDFITAMLGSAKGTVVPTIARVNQFLSEQLLPNINLIDTVYGIEIDGEITNVEPFEGNNISFIPSPILGVVHNAPAIESSRPVPQVSYATFNRALISKWWTNEPFAEFTKVELNAFPGIDAIDSLYIMKVIHA